MNTEMVMDLKAEMYFLTAFSERLADYDGFFLDCLGTSERGRSAEVLGLGTKRSVLEQKVIELLGIQVSRNGFFHLLPEALFQTLTLGNANSNSYEIIAEIRKNREREQGNRLFFSPFDTELFFFNSRLLQRQIGWPTADSHSAQAILRDLLGLDFGLTEQPSMFLLSLFANAEAAKDNAQLLGSLLQALSGREIIIFEKQHQALSFPTVPLGQGLLAVDTVLMGAVELEGDDWLVEIGYPDAADIDDSVGIAGLEAMLRQILEYFVLANRNILFKVTAYAEACNPILGHNRLGLNLQLSQ